MKTEGLGSGGEFDWSGRLGGDVALSIIGKGYGGKIEDIKNTDQGKSGFPFPSDSRAVSVLI